MENNQLDLEKELLAVMRDLNLCFQTVYELDKRLNKVVDNIHKDVEFLKAERINQLRSKDHGY